jgi:uncharacterized phage-associated protein
MAVRFTFDFDKTLAATVYLASAGISDLTKYKICKLIFLADKHHLVRFGRPITGDRLCAMDHGPVPSTTLNLLNNLIKKDLSDERVTLLNEHVVLNRTYANPRFSVGKEISLEDLLSASDLASLKETVEAHGHKSFDELKALTHEMPAYRKAWHNKTHNAPTIGYEDLFIEDSDAIEGALEDMIEDSQLRTAFGQL